MFNPQDNLKGGTKIKHKIIPQNLSRAAIFERKVLKERNFIGRKPELFDAQIDMLYVLSHVYQDRCQNQQSYHFQ